MADLQNGTVESIHIAARAEDPTHAVEAVSVLAGRGIEGDRYFHGRGTFSGRGRGYQLTLVEEQALEEVDLPWEEDDPTHWDRARGIDGRVMLAGGLGPDNVGAAIVAVRPWAVDASSSLELSPGVKDHARVRAYVEAARA